jgi:DNA repair exonuclease SbcCD ATPase subunit
MNMAMHKLKGTYEDLVKSLAKEKQSYANYADELKIKLQLQTRQTTRIVEAEKREEELSKLINHQREELMRLQKGRKDEIQKNGGKKNKKKGEGDEEDGNAGNSELTNELANEIEQLGEAFGKTEKQNVDLLKQLKFLKKQKLEHLSEKEVLKQQVNLSKQTTSVLKNEAALARRAEELATSYAKQQESKLKGVKDKMEQLTEEKQILEREIAKHRAAQVKLSWCCVCWCFDVFGTQMSFDARFNLLLFLFFFLFFCFLQ